MLGDILLNLASMLGGIFLTVLIQRLGAKVRPIAVLIDEVEAIGKLAERIIYARARGHDDQYGLWEMETCRSRVNKSAKTQLARSQAYSTVTAELQFLGESLRVCDPQFGPLTAPPDDHVLEIEQRIATARSAINRAANHLLIWRISTLLNGRH